MRPNYTKQTASSLSPTIKLISAAPRVGTLRFPTSLLTTSAADTTQNNDTHAETRAHEDSLVKRHAQLFMKRLRYELAKQGGASTRVKFYLVGEYGEKKGRPHYHAAIFGEDFTKDRYFWRKSPSGHPLYRSPTLEKAWKFGNSEIGELTFDSAAYIARYIMKKINGKLADEHYKRVNLTTGETYWITPEFALMSRGGRKDKRGLGAGWFDKFRGDIYPHDFVVMNGHPHKPPRYYDKLMETIDREAVALLKLEREFTSRSAAADNTPRRLRAKEKVALARANKNRPLE